MLARLEADADIDRPYSALLPRMSFEHGNPTYDGTRKLNTMNKIVKKLTGDSNKLQYQYGPVPYDIPFTLNIFVKNTEDGLKIIEQILPYFTPTWTTTVELIPEMAETIDIPLTLNSVTKNDMYDGSFEKRRMLIWTLDLSMKGYLYGPIKQTGIIKIAHVPFYIANTTPISDSVGNVEISEKIIIWPGLDANGAPVTFSGAPPAPNNAIDYSLIEADDDYGFIEEQYSVPYNIPRPVAGANSEQSNTGWYNEGDGAI